MNEHFHWDLMLWVFFFLGQSLFILKLCSKAIRSSTNPIKNRRDYISQNWDILIIRMAIETGLVFYPWRHGDLQSIFSHFGWTLWFKIPDGGAITATGLGYLSDSVLDWFSIWNKAPKWLKENIPSLPVSVKTTETVEVIHTKTQEVTKQDGSVETKKNP